MCVLKIASPIYRAPAESNIQKEIADNHVPRYPRSGTHSTTGNRAVAPRNPWLGAVEAASQICALQWRNSSVCPRTRLAAWIHLDHPKHDGRGNQEPCNGQGLHNATRSCPIYARMGVGDFTMGRLQFLLLDTRTVERSKIEIAFIHAVTAYKSDYTMSSTHSLQDASVGHKQCGHRIAHCFILRFHVGDCNGNARASQRHNTTTDSPICSVLFVAAIRTQTARPSPHRGVRT